jgi:hypothetical protein
MVASVVKGKEIICYYLYLLNYLLAVRLGATPPLYVSHGWGFSSYQSINTQHAYDSVSLLPSASESLTWYQSIGFHGNEFKHHHQSLLRLPSDREAIQGQSCVMESAGPRHDPLCWLRGTSQWQDQGSRC